MAKQTSPGSHWPPPPHVAHCMPALPGMHTCWPPLSWHVAPVGHEVGSATLQRRRQKLLMQESPLRQIASVVPVLLQGWFASLISWGVQAQKPPFTVGWQAAQLPGLAGLQLERHSPPMHWAPPAQGRAALHAWQVAEPPLG